MKTAKRILFGAMSLLMLAACSDDKLNEGPDTPDLPDQEAGVYFSLQIDLPNSGGSRSQTVEPGENGSTSNSGVEVGKDYENGVIEALIVLADANNNQFIAAATVNGGDLRSTNTNKSAYIAKSKFSKTQLASYYDWLDENGSAWFDTENAKSLTAHIFVFCNPTQALRASLLGGTLTTGEEVEAPQPGTSDWVNFVGRMSETHSIWAHNSFLMSNALIAERELPASITQWNRFTTSDNPFNLSQSNEVSNDLTIDNSATNFRGAIKVERTCARLDFRDGSQDNAEGKVKTGKAFTYNVLFYEDNDVVTETPIVQVTLQKMFLVNQSNSYYYLPHLATPAESSNGRSIVGVTPQELISGICKPERNWNFDGNGGFEKPWGNYVVDYDFDWKNQVYLKWKDSNEEGDRENDGNNGNAGSTTIQSDFDQYFNYPFFNNDGTIDNTDRYANRWQTYLCADVVKGEDNTTDGWTADYKDYHIWRYTTENTIPSIDGQINGISTGVVFKAKYSSPELPAGADENLKAVAAAINNTAAITAQDPVLYLFAKKLYCGWENLREAALQAADAQFTFVKTGESVDSEGKPVVEGEWELKSINRTNSLYRAVFGTGGVGTLTFTYTDDATGEKATAEWKDTLPIDENSADQAWKAWDKEGRPDNNVLDDGQTLTPEQEAVKNAYKKAVTDAGITIYQRSYDAEFGYGYYCYYYYWNRHNDNGFNGIMGPMEFAVVRNNVYKLAVTKINDLGHPRISENDPHKPGPDTPDEDESVYIEVASEILPWVVRVNNIEF